MNKRAVRKTIIALVLLSPSVASAQEWLKDRRYSEGVGIRAGGLELHPGIAGEIGYDSNWLLRSDKTNPAIVNAAPAAPVQDAAVLRITPQITLETLRRRVPEGAQAPEPPPITFRAGLAATYREFFGSDIIRQQRNISGQADARLEIMPERTVGAAVFGNYQRLIQPNILGNPDVSFNRNELGLGAELNTQPGGGTLDYHAGYQLRTTLFENDNADQFNTLQHEVFVRGRWKFRPKTAFIYDGSMRFVSFPDSNKNPSNSLESSQPVRTRFGINGLITSNIAFLGMAGWGASFFETKRFPQISQYDSVIGQAELKYYPTTSPSDAEVPGAASLTLSSISIGYVRDFAISYLANYYGLDRVYGKVSYFFAGRALLSLDAGYGWLSYPSLLDRTGTPVHPSFADRRFDATLFGEYRFVDTFGVNATVRYTQNFSDSLLPSGAVGAAAGAAGAGPQFYDMAWKRFEAYLGVRWFM